MKMPFIMEVEERTIPALQVLVRFLRVLIVGLLMAGLAALVEFLVGRPFMVLVLLMSLVPSIVALPMAPKIAPPLGFLAVLVFMVSTVILSVVGLAIAILARPMVAVAIGVFRVASVLLNVGLLLTFLGILVAFMVARTSRSFWCA
ncbi:unnamed protein product [Prorocentrum cordatum]|uniref:Vesicle transport protein n=1 Tax=Prorocentrum cordatum TaxID=2364126 RepID=A0ABN9VB34_9DINO|nr:unnamed protein product [Polarella glacialis]